MVELATGYLFFFKYFIYSGKTSVQTVNNRSSLNRQRCGREPW